MVLAGNRVFYRGQFLALLEQLTEEQYRFRIREDVNSIAWVAWHMARLEDAGVNLFVAGRPQVLDEGWLKKLNISHRDVGTGMTDEEVGEFTALVDIRALMDYRAAVGQRTLEVVESLTAENLDEVVDAEHTQRILTEAGVMGGPKAEWLQEWFQNRPKIITLFNCAVSDTTPGRSRINRHRRPERPCPSSGRCRAHRIRDTLRS